MTTIALPIADTDAFDRHFKTELRSAPTISTLQINIGLRCNLACNHCHVDSSPARIAPEENMSAETADRVMRWVAKHPQIQTIDFTGGSPEMNPNFQRMVRFFRGSAIPGGPRNVIDRCNPTIIMHRPRPRNGDAQESYDWVPQFLADHQVQVTASLPCYTAENVDKQRGRGSFDHSVQGLLALNDVGYGRSPDLPLNLVYNPGGPSLPPPESALEDDYRRELREHFGIEFTRLICITNMPIKRWRRDLERSGQLEAYMQKLIDAYNPATIEGLMCRHQVHIDPQGRLSDCDFNHALDLRVPGHQHDRLWDVDMADLEDRLIATADHCYGCTAGSGSSCGGSLV
jgi:radical SAM/Cys-rich protein